MLIMNGKLLETGSFSQNHKREKIRTKRHSLFKQRDTKYTVSFSSSLMHKHPLPQNPKTPKPQNPILLKILNKPINIKDMEQTNNIPEDKL